ncbi:MAG: glycosyltransferase family 9 protein [Phycisphaerales bacterium]|nr:glycosyltransferase family 9 protein [Phycisphaerales bacterium]
MPNWLGDGVMATPFLRAIRELYPAARIAGVVRPLVASVLSGLSYVDDVHIVKKGREKETVRWLREQRFDLGVLLPNSFRSAWMLWRGGVRRRVGYARGWRSMLLTDRLQPKLRTAEQKARDRAKAQAIRAISRELGASASPSVGSAYQPVPTIAYYMELAKFFGSSTADSTRMELGITGQEQAEAEAMLLHLGISDERFAVIVPGANFGSSKCWMPERFAQVADRLMDKQGEFDGHVILASSPAERPIVEAILQGSALSPGGKGVGRLHALARLNDGKGVSLGALKEIIRRCKLMVCNDTGPRHFGAAFDIPTVAIFGPTDPVWAETYSSREKAVRIDVRCGPCQLKRCPIDHRCMKELGVEAVIAAVSDLWHHAHHPNDERWASPPAK